MTYIIEDLLADVEELLSGDYFSLSTIIFADTIEEMEEILATHPYILSSLDESLMNEGNEVSLFNRKSFFDKQKNVYEAMNVLHNYGEDVCINTFEIPSEHVSYLISYADKYNLYWKDVYLGFSTSCKNIKVFLNNNSFDVLTNNFYSQDHDGRIFKHSHNKKERELIHNPKPNFIHQNKILLPDEELQIIEKRIVNKKIMRLPDKFDKILKFDDYHPSLHNDLLKKTIPQPYITFRFLEKGIAICNRTFITQRYLIPYNCSFSLQIENENKIIIEDEVLTSEQFNIVESW